MTRELRLQESNTETHTINSVLAFAVPGGERLVRVHIKSITVNAIAALSLGTISGGTDIINAKAISAQPYVYDHEVNSGAGSLFQINSEQKLYVSAPAWTSGGVEITCYTYPLRNAS